MKNNDNINHPDHYTGHPSGIECIEVAQYMGFCLGNAVKYIWRDGQKAGEDVNDDLRKAIWYIQCEIDKRIDEMELEKECNIESGLAKAEKPTEVPQTDTTPLVTKSDSRPITGNTLAYAQAGDARRQCEMGNMAYSGDGMPQDSEQAVEWWKKAAEQGNYDAQLRLASAYRTGTGVDQNQRLANYWLEQAGSQRTEEDTR